MREPNSRIAGGSFDDRAARSQDAAELGGLDYVQGGAVFNGAAWVLEFGFAEDGAAGFVGEAIQADEWGFADFWKGEF